MRAEPLGRAYRGPHRETPEGRPVPGKVPQEKNDKKKGKSLKEKREAKKQKKAGR